MLKHSRSSLVVERMKEIDAIVAWLRGLFRNFKRTYAHEQVRFRIFDPTPEDNGYIRFRLVLHRGMHSLLLSHPNDGNPSFYGFVAVEPGNILWVKFCYNREACADIYRMPLPDNQLEIGKIPANAAAQYMAISRGPSAIDHEIEC